MWQAELRRRLVELLPDASPEYIDRLIAGAEESASKPRPPITGFLGFLMERRLAR